MQIGSRVGLARVLARGGDRVGAERELRAILPGSTRFPAMRFSVLGLLATLLVAEGRAADALAAAEEAVALLEERGSVEEDEALVRLAHAEALWALGRQPAAVATIDRARRHLLERAAKISGESLRASFLERVPENARTLALARAWAP
jgi:hypothetical protein